MSAMFEELDWCPSPIGAVSLRRRHDPVLGADIYEIMLGREFLMTSHFTASEIALARLGLDALKGERLDVLVGGLGLGYTAQAVLEDDRVASLTVVEMLDPVIEWHETGLLRLGPGLTGDPRCRFLKGDFFALAGDVGGFDPHDPGRRFDAILVDIDHSPAPDMLLNESSKEFYDPDGLRGIARHLRPGGVFGLWSNEKPDSVFTERLSDVFEVAWASPVTFDNPLQNRPFTQSVYLARTAAEPAG